ncbi:hypothetical protein HZ326_15808 [Fusarium oxysporum f. sp. albedinis]|nr:hypothetical protein HZ326_15808 [Fusarium oxysporum f. sp. albedinis]
MQFQGTHSNPSWTSLKLGELERNQISFRCLVKARRSSDTHKNRRVILVSNCIYSYNKPKDHLGGEYVKVYGIMPRQ